MKSIFRVDIIVDKVVCLMKYHEIQIRSKFSHIFSVYLDTVYKKAGKNLKDKSVYSNYMSRKKNDVIYRQTIDLIASAEELLENMLVHPLNLTIEIKHNNNNETGTIEIPWKDSFFELLNASTNTNKTLELSEVGKYNFYHDITSKRIANMRLKIHFVHVGHTVKRDFLKNITNKVSESNCSTYIARENNLNPGTIKTRYRGKESSEYINRHNEKNIKINYNNSLETEQICRDSNYNLKNILSNENNYFSRQVFCLGYCSVETNKDMEKKHPVSERTSLSSAKSSIVNSGSGRSSGPVSSKGFLTKEIGSLMNFTECKDINCDNKLYNETILKVDSKILINLKNQNSCCANATSGKDVKIPGENTCFCTCECNFGYDKKTTYCHVCGGYEIKGKELLSRFKHELPHPCPLYHKLMDLKVSRSFILSTSGSGSRSRSLKGVRSKSQSSNKRRSMSKEFDRNTDGSNSSNRSINKRDTEKKGKKEVEKSTTDPETDNKSEKVDKDARFKFNYGYQAPQIGHSKCALSCQGTALGPGSNVPKTMGWLWTAENIPGMKFRPSWKPGATHKHVVQLLKMAKNPGTKTSKKKRKNDSRKRRKNEKKPLLVIHKKDGEYSVTMETMKSFQKQRTFNQYPYEDKSALAYTIGRTPEENLERLKKRLRAHRRLERDQREFIESSFKNMCGEICVKTYQQALGILPGTEEPNCCCFSASPDPKKYSLHNSCSCSEDKISIDSETDSDEWFVEFTPPNAKFDPAYKIKRTTKMDNSTQYDYLDYKVKIFSSTGKPIPRFFKGPDGKQQCSDLGGFWGPNKTWLEINVDGYIAPDGRWAPEAFTGPNGEQIETKTGKFQTANGNWLVVGVDGYIDAEGKWKFYKGKREIRSTQNVSDKKRAGGSGDRKNTEKGNRKVKRKRSENVVTAWSCFGDNISPKYLTEMGILGHGQDKVLLKKSVTEMLARGVDVKIPPIVKESLSRHDKKRSFKRVHNSRNRVNERLKCQHTTPSSKGIVAVDDFGNKVYFKLREYQNSRPSERIQALEEQGISTSSFHIPCHGSFINSDVLKKQLRKRIFELAAEH